MHEPFLIPIILFLSIAAVLIVWLTTRHRERITMVEKGLSSEDIKAMYARDVKRDPLRSLKWGILFVFAGVAIVFGHILNNYMHVDGDGIIVGMVAVFLGAALLLYYNIASKKSKEQQ